MGYKIGILTSTNRDVRVGADIANWLQKQVEGLDDELTYELLDIADLPFLNEPKLPSEGDYELDSTKKWSDKVASCDGFIAVLGEYNHHMPAPFKNAIDTLYAEWSRKPIAFVGYGAYGAESSIMDARSLLSHINMMPVSTKLTISRIWEALDDNREPKPDYVYGDTKKFMAELSWWTKTLAAARSTS
jgi:NAD(P)H-dependent FMN reductase